MATGVHHRVDLDAQKRISLGKLLRKSKSSATSWNASVQADGTIVLRPLWEVPHEAITQLSPTAWAELKALLKIPKQANPELLKAAKTYREAIASGQLIRGEGLPAVKDQRTVGHSQAKRAKAADLQKTTVSTRTSGSGTRPTRKR